MAAKRPFFETATWRKIVTTGAPSSPIAEDLITVRDWLRYAVSAFTKRELVYGHGTDNAFDEAAFLVLSALHLPIDQLDPWLDCKLTRDERSRIEDLIRLRIDTRKPAPYLVNCAYIQGRRFYVDERVIVPRSYIGELLCKDGLSAIVPEPLAVESVLELCTGSGCLAVLAADAFPNALVAASDISSDALEVAKRNVADHKLADRIELIQANLFDGLKTKRYDLIIANPPYVTSEAVQNLPAEYRAEPELAHLGGEDGLDIVRRIIDRARDYLNENGLLIVEIGQARETLESAFPELPFLWIDTETSEGEVFSLSAQDFTASQKSTRKTSR